MSWMKLVLVPVADPITTQFLTATQETAERLTRLSPFGSGSAARGVSVLPFQAQAAGWVFCDRSE
jgi:hypothetical protein